jgi:hypothetical protein
MDVNTVGEQGPVAIGFVSKPQGTRTFVRTNSDKMCNQEYECIAMVNMYPLKIGYSFTLRSLEYHCLIFAFLRLCMTVYIELVIII